MKSTITILVLCLASVFAGTMQAQRWARAPLPAPYDAAFYLDIYFLASQPNYGWACDNDSGFVVRTVDGGRTWQGSRVPKGPGKCHLEYVQFLNTQVGYCSGPCGIFKSVDGGVTWSAITPVGAPTVWGGWFRNVDEGWVIGGVCGYNAFLRTIDGGTTWTTYVDTTIKRSVLTDPLWTAEMPAGTVYAVGSGTIWKSINDGLAWDVHAYTGTNSPWHEELAMSGNSILIPNQGTRCDNGLPSYGMRMSPDMGLTWRDYTTGADMFGTFLHDQQRGWAAGQDAAVYYTSNSGQTWQLRNCGLEGAAMDDIFFQSDTFGWVVGRGIFYTAPPLRTQSKQQLVFKATCPGQSSRDTVLIRNINWFTSPWAATINGVNAANFRVINAPLSPSIASCTPQPIIVEYTPLTAGVHTALLTITLQQPDTTLYVELRGTRQERTAYPVDTLIVYTARVGVPITRQMTWRAIGATELETIISMRRISGDTNIDMSIQGSGVVRPEGTVTEITSIVRDTGWSTARFIVRLGPCSRDTFVTVRVYGLSPIFNSISSASADGKCKERDTIRIPISNTGNAELKITSMNMQAIGVSAFSVLGFVSGRTGSPWLFPIGASDTLLVQYQAASNNDAATLVIENDDLTRPRGVKTPWNITLLGVSLRPDVEIVPSTIDVGTVCTNAVLDRTFTISNKGTTSVTYSVASTATSIAGITTPSATLLPGQARQIRFTFTALRRGPFSDTIRVRLSPCDVDRYVVINGDVEDLDIRITPTSVNDSALIGVEMVHRFVIKLAAGSRATVRSIRIQPLPFAMITTIPTFPVELLRGDSLEVLVRWTSNVPMEYRGTLQVEANTTCSTVVEASIRLKVMSQDIAYGPSALTFTDRCNPTLSRDSIYIESIGTSPVIVSAISIMPATAPFRIISPATPVSIPRGNRRWIVVEYAPDGTRSPLTTATLEAQFEGIIPSISIPLTARLDGALIRADVGLLDAGTTSPCFPLFRRTATITNAGTLPTVATWNTTAFPAGIRIVERDLPLNANQTGTITFEFDPTALVAGVSTALVVFNESGCLTVDSMRVLVSNTSVDAMLLTPDPLDVGTIEPGATASGLATISNPTALSHRIVDLRIEPNTAPWVLINPPIGADVAAGASTVVEVQYRPIVAGTHSPRLVLVDAEQCTTQISVSLRGVARDPRVAPRYPLLLLIREHLTSPGSIVEIPVLWESDVREAMADSVSTTIEFARLNLNITSVDGSTYADALVQTSWNRDSVSITARRAGPDFGQQGVLAIIRGVAQSALPDSTPLNIVGTRVWSTEQVDVTERDGWLIVDACGPRFLIRRDAQPIIRVLPPLPARDNITVEFVAKYIDEARVSIIDAVGVEVGNLSPIAIHTGTQNFMINAGALPSGMYFLRIETQSGALFLTSIPLVK